MQVHVKALAGSVDITNGHLAEVVLAEFTRDAFKANDGSGPVRSKGPHEFVECCLPTLVPCQTNAVQDLDRWKLWFLCQDFLDRFPESFNRAGPADAACLCYGSVVGRLNGWLVQNSLNRTGRKPRLLGGFANGQPCLLQNVNFVAFHGSVHLLPLLGPVSKTVRLQGDEYHVCRPRRLRGGSEFPEKGGSEFPEPANGTLSNEPRDVINQNVFLPKYKRWPDDRVGHAGVL